MTACPYTTVLTAPAGSITFDSDTPDARAVWWYLDEFPRGWFGGGVTRSMLQPAAATGEVIGELRKTSRSLSLVGMAGVQTSDIWWTAANYLETVLYSMVDAAGELRVNEPIAKKVTVYLAGEPDIGRRLGRLSSPAENGPTKGFRFNIPLIAPNPAKVLA